MTGAKLLEQIGGEIAAVCSQLPNPDAPLTIDWLRELQGRIHRVMREAKQSVCPHISRISGARYCLECAAYLGPLEDKP